MIKILLKAVNFIVSFIVFFSLCTAGVYAAYALWDNSRIYAAAKDVQADMLKLKPQTQDVENGASFEELLAVNPDVCAWVSLDNKTFTAILPLREVYFWIPAMTEPLLTPIPCCMGIIWKTAECSEILSYIKRKHFSIIIPREC